MTPGITAVGGGAVVPRLRPRRSCLAVPGSSARFLEKAQGLPADQVFLDLEDACAPLVKESARHAIVDALNNGDWAGKTRAVRVNDWTTYWTYQDVITVVEGAGASLDCVMLPKVAGAAQIQALDLLLTQIEKAMGFEVGRIGIEAQIESAGGLVNVEAIAASSPRLETIIFGPADFMASIGMRSLVVGEQPQGYPADAYHYILMRHPGGRPRPEPAADRRPLSAGTQRRRVPRGGQAGGGAGFRRKVGAAPGPDRGGQ
jgi:citrate lyase subunit beta/citryl-CoA lyase